jgi:hypothetical protein
MLLDRKAKILEKIRPQGKNDGVCTRLYLNGNNRYDDNDMFQYTYTLEEIKERVPAVYKIIIEESGMLLDC